MTSQGSAYTRFRRALAAHNGPLAWATASEVPAIGLEDALRLCVLVSDSPARYGKAATRWFMRFCAECRGVSLAEARLVLAALDALPDPTARAGAAEALATVCERRGLMAAAEALR